MIIGAIARFKIFDIFLYAKFFFLILQSSQDSDIEKYMKIWFVFLMLCAALQASPESDACKKEIVELDKQIEKLRKEKEQHIELSRKYQADGDRWQYNTGRIQEAHEDWGKANDERDKALELQIQIDKLYERKNWIYQFYPELQYE